MASIKKIKMFILKKWFGVRTERSVYLILLGKAEVKFHIKKEEHDIRRAFYFKELEQWPEK